MSQERGDWHARLAARGFLAMLVASLVLLVALLLTMGTGGRSIVRQETSRRIQQVGNNLVSELETRMQEIAALTRTLAETVEQLPRSAESVESIVPHLIGFQGDLDIAGGGVWPEPFRFDPDRERRSFFWARDPSGSLEYIDDYNTSEQSYHKEPWYVVARHLSPGKCSWSKSYRDPFSREPMVTATVATYDEDDFSGAVTIDLRLAGMRAFTDEWRRRTGGYVFIVDQFDTLISFPESDSGIEEDEIPTVAGVASNEPLFRPIAAELEAMTASLIEDARELPGYDPATSTRIAADSPALEPAEASVLAATIADPFAGSSFHKQFTVEDDFLLDGEATVYTFFVPSSYWKVGIVIPTARAAQAATRISFWLVLVLVPTALALAGLLYLAVSRGVERPLERLRGAVDSLVESLSSGRFESVPLERSELETAGVIGSLASSLDRLNGLLEADRRRSSARQEEAARSLAELRESEDLLMRRIAELEEARGDVEGAAAAGASSAPQAGGAPASGSPLAVSRVWDDLLLLPEVAAVDAGWAEALLSLLAEETRRDPVRHLVIDLTRTPVGDAERSAETLSHIARSADLLGARLSIVGLAAEVAAALAETGAAAGRLRGFARIADALRAAGGPGRGAPAEPPEHQAEG